MRAGCASGEPSPRSKGSRLPIVDSSPKPRPSKATRWRAGVLIAVHVVVAAHVAHWAMTGSTLTPVEPSEAMAFAKAGTINAGLLFFAAMILATAIFGRFFCGWGCHVVALQDLSASLLGRFGIKPRPFKSRLLRWVPMVAFVYMFLWPVAYRLWIGDSFGRVQTEVKTSAFWATFPTWPVALLTFFVCGFVVVYFLGAKGFCTYACPYGAIFGVADKLAPGRIRVTDACEGCAHCTAVCTSNVRVHEEVRDYGMVVSPGCMKCMDCVSVCPKQALYFGWGKPSLFAAPRVAQPARPKPELSLGEEVFTAAAFVLAFVTFRGLYDAVPFLLSLGIGAAVAYLALLTLRLFTRRDVHLKRWALRRDGTLQTAGHVFLAAMVLFAIFCLHSGWVQGLSHRGDRRFARDADLRTAAMKAGPGVVVPTAAREQAEGTLAVLRQEERWGLVEPVRLSLQLAWTQFVAGRYEAFRVAAEKALAVYPNDAQLRLQLARLYVQQGRTAEAVAAFERTLATNPQMANAYLQLGILLGQGGDLAGAASVFERGIAALPEVGDLYYNAGLVAAYQGRLDVAEGRFRQAVAVDPRHLEARENLAGVLAESGRYREAAEEFERAVAQSGTDASTYVLLARAYLGAGEPARARQAAERALALDPNQAEARQLLAEIH